MQQLAGRTTLEAFHNRNVALVRNGELHVLQGVGELARTGRSEAR